MFDHVKMFID
jgi:hypothetical protein